MTNSVEQESESGNFGDDRQAIPPPPPRNVAQQQELLGTASDQNNIESPSVQLGTMDVRPTATTRFATGNGNTGANTTGTVGSSVPSARGGPLTGRTTIGIGAELGHFY